MDMDENMITDRKEKEEQDFQLQSATSDRGALAEALRRAGLYDAACLNMSSPSSSSHGEGDGE